MTYLDQSFTVIRKPSRRTLSVKLSPHHGHKIFVNQSLSQKIILDFLMKKKDWLEKNIAQIEQFKKNEHRPTFHEGQLFPFLGEMKYLTFIPSDQKKIKMQIEDGFMVCYVPVNLKPDQMQKHLVDLYKSEARKYLVCRCQDLAQEMNLIPRKIKIQTARTRWGSCSSLKVVNLNWKLMVFSSSLIDYVIVHELCHLKHLNHSNDFWSLVEKYLPQYQEAEAFFKTEGLKISAFLN